MTAIFQSACRKKCTLAIVGEGMGSYTVQQAEVKHFISAGIRRHQLAAGRR